MRVVTKEEVIEKIRKGAYGFGSDYPDNKKFREDLRKIGFDFVGTNLVDAQLRGADLRGINFRAAHLQNVGLVGAKIDEDQIIPLAVAVHLVDLNKITPGMKWGEVIKEAKRMLEMNGVKIETVMAKVPVK